MILQSYKSASCKPGQWLQSGYMLRFFSPILSASIFQHYLLRPSFSCPLFHLHQCPYSMPACFLDPLLQLLLPGLKQQLSNWPTQISTILTFFSEFHIFLTRVSRWDSISYSYIELWSGLCTYSTQLIFGINIRDVIDTDGRKTSTLEGTAHVQSGLKRWKSSIQDLVGPWHWKIGCYTPIMHLIISRQKLSTSPYPHNLEVATSRSVCQRKTIIFSCLIQQKSYAESWHVKLPLEQR